MGLFVKRYDTGERVQVKKYIIDLYENEESIWSNDWYGRHVIGRHCEWCDGKETPDEQSNCIKPAVRGRSEQFTCKHCGTNEKVWSRKNDDWYCKTCGHICR